jgi:hypothetical protein
LSSAAETGFCNFKEEGFVNFGEKNIWGEHYSITHLFVLFSTHYSSMNIPFK